MAQSECKSGCGIYAIGTGKDNIISENIIRNVADCGIFADRTIGSVINNRVISYPETAGYADSNNVVIKARLDEDLIQSILEDKE